MKDIFKTKKLKNFERADKKGLLNDLDFLAQNMEEWDEFSKFIIILDKELKSSKSVRQIIISSSIAVEHFIDLIFNRMYHLDTYRKFNYKDFLSGITFSKKIDYLRKLKKNYKKKKPKTKEYKEHFTANLAFYKELLKTPSGKNLLKEIENVNEIVNKKNGIAKPTPSYLSTAINPYKKINDDYLSDEIFSIVKKVNLTKLEKIREMRNIVAHKWDYQTGIAKSLNVKQKRQLENKVKLFCRDVLDSMVKK